MTTSTLPHTGSGARSGARSDTRPDLRIATGPQDTGRAATTPSVSARGEADLDRLSAGRDRVIDLARAVSMVAVAIGHWLVSDVRLAADGGFRVIDVLAALPAMQALTWVFQVMPVFFFAGGVVGFVSWQRHRAAGHPAGGWIAARVWRLMWPTLPVVTFWVVVTQVGDRMLDLPAEVLAASRGIALVTWFLAVYALVVAAIPFLDRAAARWGLAVPASLLALAFAVDQVVRATSPDLPMWVFVNYLAVWGAITCLGRWWPSVPRAADVRWGLGLAAVAGTALVASVATGLYPLSMVGVAGAERSNSWPPTLGLAMLGLVQVGLLLAARPTLDRWLQRPAAYRAVAVLGARAMTIYLWHPLAVAVLALAFVLPGTWPMPVIGTATWWMMRLAWITLAAAVTVPVVLAVGRLERPPAVALTRSTRRAVVATVALSVGWTALALQGFHVPGLPGALPLAALVGLGLGAGALVVGHDRRERP